MKLRDEVGGLTVAPTGADDAGGKGIEVIVYCEPGMVTGRRGDPVRLRQILLNLAANAVKFTRTGSVTIRALQVAGQHDQVALEIIDTGIGIPQSEHARLFEPFSQLDESTTRRFGGTGLGLAIVTQLVALHRGSIDVQSEPGCTLHGWGFLVDQAASAEDALDQFGWSGAPSSVYALALIEHQMDGMDGIGLAEVLRLQAPTASTGILLLTSVPGLSRQAAHAAGIQSVLIKPVRNAYLLRRIMDGLITNPISSPARALHPKDASHAQSPAR